jgi:cyclomaltodextrinase
VEKIKIGKYRHYKGKYYEVVAVARHSDTLREFVIYRSLYYSKKFGKKDWWIKPAYLFKNKSIPRFKFISK